MKKSHQIFLSVLVCLLVVLGIYHFAAKPQNNSGEASRTINSVTNQDQKVADLSVDFPDYATTTISIDGTVIKMVIAGTEEEQMQGLSGIDSMPENFGMVFQFSEPDIYSFWMKDMKFPLDILWADVDGNITHIEKSLTPDTYPKSYSSTDNSLYVLELNAGFSDKHEIKIGDKIIFLEN